MTIQQTLAIEIPDIEEDDDWQIADYRMQLIRERLSQFVSLFIHAHCKSEEEAEVVRLGIASDIFKSVQCDAIAELAKRRLRDGSSQAS